jgi:hypothetical protein
MLAWESLSCCLQLGLIWPGGGVSGGWGCRLVGAYVAMEVARNKLVAPLNHRPPERYERFFRALEQRARGDHRGPPGGLRPRRGPHARAAPVVLDRMLCHQLQKVSASC